MSLSRPYAAVPFFAALAAVTTPAAAETVRFDTVFGGFDVNLFDEATPAHVANFLAYVDAGDYDSTIIHRAAESAGGGEFVVQGGGFRFDGVPVENPSALEEVQDRGTVTNEPGIPNTRGTLALARVGGQENSGTNQFFFNLQDNDFLNDVDGGFTVFGEVADDEGLSVLDRIAAVPTFEGPAPFGELPLRDFAFEEGVTPQLGADEFVLVNSIIRVEVEEVPGVVPEEPGTPTDGDDGDDLDSPTDPVAVPTPGAALAGLFGLAAVAARRPRAGGPCRGEG